MACSGYLHQMLFFGNIRILVFRELDINSARKNKKSMYLLLKEFKFKCDTI